MSTASDAEHGTGNGGGAQSGRRHTAGAYDVRTVIAGLIGFYGIVLTIMGIVGQNADDRTKTGDVNANLWAGIVMIVVALVFVLWLRLRPVVIEDGHAVEDGTGGPDTAGH